MNVIARRQREAKRAATVWIVVGCRVATALLGQWSAAAVLVSIGSFALALGLLVYMAGRDPASAMLFPTVAALSIGPVFGTWGLWLPSLVHPFAFSLFTAAALPPRASPPYGVCASWWVVNIVFEAVQHGQVSGGFAATLHRVFGDCVLVRALSDYALHGSFDAADIVASTAGALAAAGVLSFVQRQEMRHAH